MLQYFILYIWSQSYDMLPVKTHSQVDTGTVPYGTVPYRTVQHGIVPLQYIYCRSSMRTTATVPEHY